jgi:hypothetical protein
VDLYDFASKVVQHYEDANVVAAAQHVMDVLNVGKVDEHHRSGAPWMLPDNQRWELDNVHGLSIFLPLGEDLELPDVITSTSPITPGLVMTQNVKLRAIYTANQLRFVDEHSWDELVSAYYTAVATPVMTATTTGPAAGLQEPDVIPPQSVITASPLVNVGETLAVHWSTTDSKSSLKQVALWRQPPGGEWAAVVTQTVPLDTGRSASGTFATVLDEGCTHRLAVIAVDAIDNREPITNTSNLALVEAQPCPQAVDDVSIAGANVGLAGALHTFTATAGPLTATLPITFVWQTTGQPPVTHANIAAYTDTFNVTWTTPGVQEVSVTASNAGGSATHLVLIDIEDKPALPRPKPVTKANINGASGGVVNALYTFTATVDPLTATLPITFVWRATGQPPVTHPNVAAHTDTFAAVWTTPGAKEVGVTASNAAGRATYSVSIDIDDSTAHPPRPKPVTKVNINGATVGVVDDAYTFTATASPPTATLPITFVWQATGQPPVTHANVAAHTDTFSAVWTTPGAQGVGVTAINAGASASTAQIVTVVTGTVAAVTPGQGGELTYQDSAGLTTTIQAPAGAVVAPITLAFAPASTVTESLSLIFVGRSFGLAAYQNDALQPGFAFAKPVTVTIHYTDSEVTHLDEMQLTLLYWDGDAWVDAATTCQPTSTYHRETTANWLRVSICHLSSYALFGGGGVYLPVIACTGDGCQQTVNRLFLPVQATIRPDNEQR